MSTISGDNLEIKVRKETEEGVPENSGFGKIARNSYKFEYGISEIESPTVRDGRDQSEVSFGSQEVTGEIEIPLDSEASGIFLGNVFGKYSVQPSGSKFEHSYEVTDKTLSSLQIEDTSKDSSNSFRILGAKTNTFELNLGDEGQVKAKFGFNAKFKYMNKIVVDSDKSFSTSDYSINTKTIVLDSNSGFEAGQTIVIARLESTLTEDVSDSRSVPVAALAGFSEDDFIEINGIEAKVETVGTSGIYLDRKITASASDEINVLNNEYIITSVSTIDESVSFEPGLKTGVSALDKVYQKKSNSAFLTKEYFDNKQVQIRSQDGTITDCDVEKFAFKFSNEQERQKTISCSKIVDRKTKVEVEMDLIINRESEVVFASATNNLKFDITINMISNLGNEFILDIYNCKIIPGDAERGAPGIVKISLKGMPFKSSNGNYIKARLINDIPTY